MAVRPIVQYPDPVLRVRCPEVAEIDDELRGLARDMAETMYAAPGIGLAAPQVGVETRLAVVDVTGGLDENGNENRDNLLVLVNPVVLAATGAESDTEGCLSIPGISEKVERPAEIRLRALDLDGNEIELEAEGLLARAILHEIDHLDGVLFVDRLRGLRRARVARQLRRLKSERAREEVLA